MSWDAMPCNSSCRLSHAIDVKEAMRREPTCILKSPGRRNALSVVQIAFVSVPKAEAMRPLCPKKFALEKERRKIKKRVEIQADTQLISCTVLQGKARTRVLASVVVVQSCHKGKNKTLEQTYVIISYFILPCNLDTAEGDTSFSFPASCCVYGEGAVREMVPPPPRATRPCPSAAGYFK